MTSLQLRSEGKCRNLDAQSPGESSGPITDADPHYIISEAYNPEAIRSVAKLGFISARD